VHETTFAISVGIAFDVGCSPDRRAELGRIGWS